MYIKVITSLQKSLNLKREWLRKAIVEKISTFAL